MHMDTTNKIKSVKLVDKTRRAFSISIESSKAFELAIRKPRKKCKHTITRIRAFFYGMYLLLLKHHGRPPSTVDLTTFFVLYAAVLSLDLLILINFFFRLFLPITNMADFGWAFLSLYPLLPLASPVMAVVSAITGSVELLKTTSNMNSTMIIFNIPITFAFALIHRDDPQFMLSLIFMIFIKVGFSLVSAKVQQNLVNPRYAKNQEKL